MNEDFLKIVPEVHLKDIHTLQLKGNMLYCTNCGEIAQYFFPLSKQYRQPICTNCGRKFDWEKEYPRLFRDYLKTNREPIVEAILLGHVK